MNVQQTGEGKLYRAEVEYRKKAQKLDHETTRSRTSVVALTEQTAKYRDRAGEEAAKYRDAQSSGSRRGSLWRSSPTPTPQPAEPPTVKPPTKLKKFVKPMTAHVAKHHLDRLQADLKAFGASRMRYEVMLDAAERWARAESARLSGNAPDEPLPPPALSGVTGDDTSPSESRVTRHEHASRLMAMGLRLWNLGLF